MLLIFCCTFQTDAGNWDDRTSTLTFHTFRPKSPAELVPVLGVTHQMLNGTYDRRQSKTNDMNNFQNVDYAFPTNNNKKSSHNQQHSYYYQSPIDLDQSSDSFDPLYVDIFVDVELKPNENRVGFSMSGGQQDNSPTIINNVLECKSNWKFLFRNTSLNKSGCEFLLLYLFETCTKYVSIAVDLHFAILLEFFSASDVLSPVSNLRCIDFQIIFILVTFL